MPPGLSNGFVNGPSTCEEDCSCDHLEFLTGEYVYQGFFPANNRAESWCFPNMYDDQICIDVTCGANGTWCDFGSHNVSRMDLAGTGETDLIIKARYEPYFLNFSVGLVMDGLLFEELNPICSLDD